MPLLTLKRNGGGLVRSSRWVRSVLVKNYGLVRSGCRRSFVLVDTNGYGLVYRTSRGRSVLVEMIGGESGDLVRPAKDGRVYFNQLQYIA